VASPQAMDVGARLDADHGPETNGRMAVCRRCGAPTDGPDGTHHVPHDDRLARCTQWLDAQARLRHIDRARGTFA